MTAKLKQKYPKSVYFTKSRFPDFSPYAKLKYTFKNGFVDGDYKDFSQANKHFNLKGKDLKSWTWHHLPDEKTMILVPLDLHDFVRHTRGAAMKGLRRR